MASGRPQRTKRFRGIEDKTLLVSPGTVPGSPNGSDSDYVPAGMRTGKGKQSASSTHATAKATHALKAACPTTTVHVTHQQLQQQLHQKEHASHAFPDGQVSPMQEHSTKENSLVDATAAFSPGSVPHAARYKLLADGIAARGECAELSDICDVQPTDPFSDAQLTDQAASTQLPMPCSPRRGRQLSTGTISRAPVFGESTAEMSPRRDALSPTPYDTISRSPVFGEVAAEVSPRRDPFASYAASMLASSPRKFSLSPISRDPAAGEDAAEISPRRDSFSSYDLPMPKIPQRKLSLSPLPRQTVSECMVPEPLCPRPGMSLLSALSPPRPSPGGRHPSTYSGQPESWGGGPKRPADGSENTEPKCMASLGPRLNRPGHASTGGMQGNHTWGACKSGAHGASASCASLHEQSLDGLLDAIIEPSRNSSGEYRNSPTHPLLACPSKRSSQVGGAPSQRHSETHWELSFSQLPSVPLSNTHAQLSSGRLPQSVKPGCSDATLQETAVAECAEQSPQRRLTRDKSITLNPHRTRSGSPTQLAATQSTAECMHAQHAPPAAPCAVDAATEKERTAPSLQGPSLAHVENSIHAVAMGGTELPVLVNQDSQVPDQKPAGNEAQLLPVESTAGGPAGAFDSANQSNEQPNHMHGLHALDGAVAEAVDVTGAARFNQPLRGLSEALNGQLTLSASTGPTSFSAAWKDRGDGLEKLTMELESLARSTDLHGSPLTDEELSSFDGHVRILQQCCAQESNHLAHLQKWASQHRQQNQALRCVDNTDPFAFPGDIQPNRDALQPVHSTDSAPADADGMVPGHCSGRSAEAPHVQNLPVDLEDFIVHADGSPVVPMAASNECAAHGGNLETNDPSCTAPITRKRQAGSRSEAGDLVQGKEQKSVALVNPHTGSNLANPGSADPHPSSSLPKQKPEQVDISLNAKPVSDASHGGLQSGNSAFENVVRKISSRPPKPHGLLKMGPTGNASSAPSTIKDCSAASVQGRVTPPDMMMPAHLAMHGTHASHSAPAATTKTQFQLSALKPSTPHQVAPVRHAMHGPAMHTHELTSGLPPSRVSSIYRTSASSTGISTSTQIPQAFWGMHALDAWAPVQATQTSLTCANTGLNGMSKPSAVPEFQTGRHSLDCDRPNSSGAPIDSARTASNDAMHGHAHRRASVSVGHLEGPGRSSDDDESSRATVTGKRSTRSGAHAGHSWRRTSRGRTSSSI